MKVFVTGGSGYLGGHLIRRLVAEGHEVTGHARSEGSAARVRALGVRTVTAPLTAEAPLLEALRGHDAVVHAAAHFALWGPWRLFQEGVIDATLALHRAAASADVPRFVYISAAGVVSGNLPPVVDEGTPYPRRHTAFYAQAKALTETALRYEPEGGNNDRDLASAAHLGRGDAGTGAVRGRRPGGPHRLGGRRAAHPRHGARG